MCFTCPVPEILQSNACQFMVLEPHIVRPFPFTRREVRVKTFCNKTHRKGFDPHIGCGECHHDDKGKPLNELKLGDDVQSCIACHKKPGQMPGELKKEMKEKKASKKEIKKTEMEYHAEAIHDNCITCHKAHNKKNKTKDAPQTCTKCHPKEK